MLNAINIVGLIGGEELFLSLAKEKWKERRTVHTAEVFGEVCFEEQVALRRLSQATVREHKGGQGSMRVCLLLSDSPWL